MQMNVCVYTHTHTRTHTRTHMQVLKRFAIMLAMDCSDNLDPEKQQKKKNKYSGTTYLKMDQLIPTRIPFYHYKNLFAIW